MIFVFLFLTYFTLYNRLYNFGMPMTTHPYQATEKKKTLTTGGSDKEQGTNKLPPTRILQRSTRGQQEMRDCPM